MEKVGLVLEGGGMRGMFTAGVLDFFLDEGLEFPCIVGVSAGAIHACSFLSKQKYRSRDITLKYINDKRYCSFRSLFTSGDMFNVRFSYYEIPEKLFPFDKKTFNKSRTKLLVTATDIVKGKAKYFHIKSFDNGEIEALRASASLPMISNIVKYKGKEYLDGGLSDGIPIKKIEAEGYEKNIIILTRPDKYRKRKSRSYLTMIKRYRKYPLLIKLLKGRHTSYNETAKYLEEQEKEGKAFVIRPDLKLKIKRIDKNCTRLEAAYNSGYESAKKQFSELKKFMDAK